MITFNGKQVLVTGVEAQYAQVHYAKALGTSVVVEIADLRATTLQELEDVLLNATRVSLAGQEVRYPESDGEQAEHDELHADARDFDTPGDRFDDRIATFRAEY